MAEDHLDTETSVTAEITSTGIKAGAKSRFVAAVDRLAGGVVDVLNAHVEAPAKRRRAKTEAEVTLIEAAAEYGVKMLGADPAMAERAFNKHFRKIVREQENSEAVAKEALEDLRANPATEESNANDTPLSEEFLERVETYSAAASTDELRKRWGRVLAAEVRKPGTFSSKVLRVVDELDSSTALQFEEVAKHRIGQILPKALVGEIAYNVRNNLVLSDLMIDPGIAGQIMYFHDATTNAGENLKMAGFLGIGAVAFPGSTSVNTDTAAFAPLTSDNGKAGIPCYLLTDVGQAIASILPDLQFGALQRYVQAAANSDQLEWVRLYIQSGSGDLMMMAQLSGKKASTTQS